MQKDQSQNPDLTTLSCRAGPFPRNGPGGRLRKDHGRKQEKRFQRSDSGFTEGFREKYFAKGIGTRHPPPIRGGSPACRKAFKKTNDPKLCMEGPTGNPPWRY